MQPSNTPDTPARHPAMEKTIMMIRLELIPIILLVSGLMATALMARPIFVLLIRSINATNKTTDTAKIMVSIFEIFNEPTLKVVEENKAG